MPQSSAALRAKAEALRLLRHPSAAQRPPFQPAKPVWAKRAFACQHGACLALEVRVDGLWVLVRDAAQAEAFAPAARVLRDEQRREWARNGFG